MMKRKSLCFTLLIGIYTLFAFQTAVFAKAELEVIDTLKLKDSPLDIVISRDGATAYILCENNILIYSMEGNKITDSIPLAGKFTEIALSPDNTRLLLTNTKEKQVSIVQVSQIYDMEIGQSPIIGDKDAPLSLFVFFDFQ